MLSLPVILETDAKRFKCMNSTITLLVGFLIGTLIMYLASLWCVTPRTNGTWTAVSVAESENDAAWKLNVVTGEMRYCLMNKGANVGCVKVRDTNSLQELTGSASANTP